MARPKVAIVATTYFSASHADVIATRLIEGYEFAGERTTPRVEVASMYIEQVGATRDGAYVPDIGQEIADRNGVALYSTVAEAMGCGRAGVNVDGVAIVGEHGDYELNQFGQKLYPRRRLFDAAVAAMIGAGRTVPIFIDKHLAWSFSDARAMVETARRLGIPLLAGSSVPLAWRIPTGAEWPLRAELDEAVAVGYGPTESYGFHILEALQCQVERRAGGESGVVAVQAMTGNGATRALEDGVVPPDLVASALTAFDLDENQQEPARRSVKDVFLVEYVDGVRAAAVNFDHVVRGFSVACRGPGTELACQMWLEKERAEHFTFLARQIEALASTGRAPYPVQRTQLTTGVLDVAMRSRHRGGARLPTPELAIAYEPVSHVPDTGVGVAVPATARSRSDR